MNFSSVSSTIVLVDKVSPLAASAGLLIIDSPVVGSIAVWELDRVIIPCFHLLPTISISAHCSRPSTLPGAFLLNQSRKCCTKTKLGKREPAGTNFESGILRNIQPFAFLLFTHSFGISFSGIATSKYASILSNTPSPLRSSLSRIWLPTPIEVLSSGPLSPQPMSSPVSRAPFPR